MVSISERRGEEQTINHEIIETHNVVFGIAASNSSNKHNPDLLIPQNISNLTDFLIQQQLGVEIEFEGVKREDIPQFTKPRFLGVHQPLHDVDTADPRLREESFQTIFDAMQITHDIGAEYFTIHPQTRDYWGDLPRREWRIEKSMEDVDTIVNEYQRNGYEFTIFIENLEYPKFPATAEEIDAIATYIEHRSDVSNLKLAVDIGHLWHSGYLIEENLWRHEVNSMANDWGRLRVPYKEHLDTTLKNVQDKVGLIHLTGCSDHRTHDLPGTIQSNPSTAIPDREYSANELDIRDSLEVVYDVASGMNRELYVVNEAMGYEYKQIAQNCQSLIEMSEKSTK